MGRTDEVQFMLECAAEWRRLGATVTFQAGWESRGNGTQGNYEGCVVHHTASSTSEAKPNPTLSVLINGRPDLSGPLCNVTGPWCTEAAPRLYVVAAFPANHAGASGGRSMGPLPVTSLFNPRVLGLEIDYAGTVAMTAGQYRAALIFARGATNVLQRSTEYVRAHAETSITGKWDPGYASGKTIDMAAFRRDAAAITTPGGFLAMLNDAEQARLLENTDRIAAELMGTSWRDGKYGWPARRAGLAAAAQPSLTLVDYLREIDKEVNGRLPLTGRPSSGDETPFGRVLNIEALSRQILIQAQTAATRNVSVDASQIDMSKVIVPAAPAVDEAAIVSAVNARVEALFAGLEDRIADKIAARMAS